MKGFFFFFKLWSSTEEPVGKMVLPTIYSGRKPVIIQMSPLALFANVVSGHCRVCLFSKLLSITWPFSSFHQPAPVCSPHLWHFGRSNWDDHCGLELSLLPFSFCLSSLPSPSPSALLLFLLPSTDRDGSPRQAVHWPVWCPDVEGAQQLIAVMALRALSQTIRMLTSPPLNVHGSEGRVVGGGWVVTLPSPLSHYHHPPFASLPVFSMTHHENKKVSDA